MPGYCYPTFPNSQLKLSQHWVKSVKHRIWAKINSQTGVDGEEHNIVHFLGFQCYEADCLRITMLVHKIKSLAKDELLHPEILT